jgi:hypothetical protein
MDHPPAPLQNPTPTTLKIELSVGGGRGCCPAPPHATRDNMRHDDSHTPDHAHNPSCYSNVCVSYHSLLEPRFDSQMQLSSHA